MIFFTHMLATAKIFEEQKWIDFVKFAEFEWGTFSFLTIAPFEVNVPAAFGKGKQN